MMTKGTIKMIVFFRRRGETGLATVKVFADTANQILDYFLENDVEWFPVPGVIEEVVDLRVNNKGEGK
jgi:hypothetical protein